MVVCKLIGVAGVITFLKVIAAGTYALAGVVRLVREIQRARGDDW